MEVQFASELVYAIYSNEFKSKIDPIFSDPRGKQDRQTSLQSGEQPTLREDILISLINSITYSYGNNLNGTFQYIIEGTANLKVDDVVRTSIPIYTSDLRPVQEKDKIRTIIMFKVESHHVGTLTYQNNLLESMATKTRVLILPSNCLFRITSVTSNLPNNGYNIYEAELTQVSPPNLMRLNFNHLIAISSYVTFSTPNQRFEANKFLNIFRKRSERQLVSNISIEKINIFRIVFSDRALQLSFSERLNSIRGSSESIEPIQAEPDKVVVSDVICRAVSSIQEKPCTTIGKQISENLVRVACSRIFANPHQSIIELPVNGIDSYNRLAGITQSVGKFGMGFFSILYWIVTDPGAELVINSTYKSEGRLRRYCAILSYDNDVNVTVYENLIPGKETGTTIQLNLRNSTFDIQKFKDELFRLVDVRSCKITIKINCTISILNGFVDKNVKNLVEMELDSTFLTVRDRAEGIDINVLFNTLLVPSISTKTISKSISTETMIGTYSIDNTRCIPAPSTSMNEPYTSNFIMTVGDICVYSTEKFDRQPKLFRDMSSVINSNHWYILSLPLNTQLPVSRDDIIMSEETSKIFRERLRKLINLTIEQTKDVSELFDMLNRYSTYSKQVEVHNIVNDLIQEVINSDIILVPARTKVFDLINAFVPSIKFVGCNPIPLARTEAKLEAILSQFISRSTFFAKLVVFVENLFKETGFYATNGGLPSFLFIDSDRFKNDGEETIMSSYTEGKLIPVELVEKTSMEVKIRRFSRFFKYRKYKNLDNFFTTLLYQAESCEIEVNQLYNGFNPLSAPTSSNLICFEDLFGPDGMDEFFLKMSSVFSSNKINTPYGSYVRSREMIGKTLNLNKKDLPSIRKTTKWKFLLEGISNYVKRYERVYEELREFYIDIIVATLKGGYFPYFCRFDLPCVPIAGSEVFNKFLLKCDNFYERLVFGAVAYHVYFNSDLKLARNEILVYDFILQNIRTRHSMIKLMTYVKNAVLTNNIHIMTTDIYTPVILTTFTFIEYIENESNMIYHIKSIFPVDDSLMGSTFSFTCKQILLYIYSSELTEGLNWISEVHKYSADDVKMQTIEIATNEGTTKAFMYSILSELVQNSLDALRQRTRSNLDVDSDYVNLSIGDYLDNKSISVYDPVGIPDKGILSIMVPFLSTKSSNDALATGEMGSGFFNCFRYPWCKSVIVETSRDNRSVKITATPIIERSRVVDIKYDVSIGLPLSKSQTQIIINLNSTDVEKMSSTLADAYIFSRNYLSVIDYPIFINGEKENVNRVEVFSTEIGTCYWIQENIVTSSVMTNGVPFSLLSDFLTGFNYYSQVIGLVATSCVININRGWYTPVQSRNKVQLKDTKKIKDFLDECIFRFVIRRFVSENNPRDEDWFPHLRSKSDPRQLRISERNCPERAAAYFMMNFSLSLFHSVVDVINNTISECTSTERAIEKILSYEIKGVDSYLKQAMVIWFENKKYMNDKSVNGSGDRSGIKERDKEFDNEVMTKFVSTFWKLLNSAIETGRIRGIKIRPDPPTIKFSMTNIGTLGFYTPSHHKITISTVSYSMEAIDSKFRKIRDLYRQDRKLAIMELFSMEAGDLYKLMFNGVPAKTLIHELSHAWRSEDHKGSSHSGITLSLRQGAPKEYSFDEAAVAVYGIVLEEGLVEQWFSS